MPDNFTIKYITSYDECASFVNDFCGDPVFSDPMLSNAGQIRLNLINAIEEKEHHAVFCINAGWQMIGLFSFLVLSDERYLEMLAGLSRQQEAYRTMLAYLKKQFAGYKADFVFNPNHFLLKNALIQNGAVLEPEEQKMIYRNALVRIDTTGIELLTKPYIPAYLQMHRTDLYWTGEKILAAKDTFRTFIATENGALAGYLDVTFRFEENEPYDLWIREASRRKGYARKLLAKALEMNRPNKMTALVEADNKPAIRLYESLGFEKADQQNSVTAHLEM